jgi:hypothetical protein
MGTLNQSFSSPKGEGAISRLLIVAAVGASLLLAIAASLAELNKDIINKCK